MIALMIFQKIQSNREKILSINYLSKQKKLFSHSRKNTVTIGIKKLKKKKAYENVSLFNLVGTAGFELATPCTPCKCATRLRYAPKGVLFYQK